VRVESPEVDQLACRIDLGLECRLRLAEHRGGVERCSPGRREELRGLEEYSGPILPRPVRPVVRRFLGGANSLVDVFFSSAMPLGEHVLVVVWHHGLR